MVLATRGSTTGLEPGEVTINGTIYRLAYDATGYPKGQAWWRPEPQSYQNVRVGELVTSRWDFGAPQGMGEVRRIAGDTLSYHFSEGWDCSLPQVWRLAPRRFSVTPATATTDNPTWFFSQGGAVFCCQASRAYRLTITSANVITVAATNTFSGSPVVGKPAKFEGEWQLPLGANRVFASLTTPATNVWTDAAANMNALAFAVMNDGAIAKIWRASNSNRVDSAQTAPRTSGNWSGGDSGSTGFEVGDSSNTITSMVETGIVLAVASDQNLFIFELTGNPEAIFNILSGDGDSDNGVGLAAIPGTEFILYNHQTGLHLLNGNTPRLNIGPDGIPTNRESRISAVTLEPYGGRHYDSTIVGRWCYSLYRVVVGGSTRTWLLGGPIIGEKVRWHTIDYLASWARGLEATYDSTNLRYRLWTTSGGDILFWNLGPSGAPDGGPNSSGRGAASTTYTLYLPEVPFYKENGEPVGMVNKQLERVEVESFGLGDTSPVQLQCSRDGAAVENVGSPITGNGVTNRFWTAGTNDTARWVQMILQIATTGAYAPATSDPQILSFTVVASCRPDIGDIIRFVVDTSLQRDSLDPLTVRNNLQALESGASVTVLDPDGTSLTLNIEQVQDVSAWENSQGSMDYLIEVVARQRSTS